MSNNQNQDDKYHYGKFSVVLQKDLYKGDRYVIEINKDCSIKAIALDNANKVLKLKIKKAEFVTNRLYKNIVVFSIMSRLYDEYDMENVRFVMEQK